MVINGNGSENERKIPGMGWYILGGIVVGELASWGMWAAADTAAPLNVAWPWLTGIGTGAGAATGIGFNVWDRYKARKQMTRIN